MTRKKKNAFQPWQNPQPFNQKIENDN